MITNNDETAYREVRALGVWCQENNLILNVNKTKEMIMDFRKQQRKQFLGAHITDKLKWSTHTDSVVKKAQQRLFNLRRLKKFGLSLKTLTNFYRCTTESILSGCITAWHGNCSAHICNALHPTSLSSSCFARRPGGDTARQDALDCASVEVCECFW